MAGDDGEVQARTRGPIGKRRRGRGGRNRQRGGRDRAPRRKTQEELDLEMDILAAERDGKSVDEVKAAFRAKREAAKKNKLDSQMDSYFQEEDESKDKEPANPEDSKGLNASSKTEDAVKLSPTEKTSGDKSGKT